MMHSTIARNAYHYFRPYADLCRPAALRRKALMAWARYRGKPIADSLPGLEKKMWLSPDEYYAHFYESQCAAEPGVLEFLKKHITPGMTIFDIGANVGYMTLFCAGLTGKQGSVIAFEPGERAYERLEANIQLNHMDNVIPVREAVSDTDGYESYCQAVRRREDFYNSLLSVDTPWTSVNNFHTTQIPVHRLDTLIAKSGWPVPHLVKVDVEGAERKVLRGMRETLRSGQTRILVLEISDLYFAKFGYSVRELVEELEQSNFFCLEIEENGHLSELQMKNGMGRGRIMAAMRG
jgi:FkbM family methyltransferase